MEAPDGLAPVPAENCKDGNPEADASSGTFLRYADTDISAGIYNDMGRYKTVAIGFPIETVKDGKAIDSIMEVTLKFFEQ